MKTKNTLPTLITASALLAFSAFAFVGCSESSGEANADSSPLSSSDGSAAELSLASSADGSGHGPGILRLSEELGLSDEQIASITAISESYHEKFETLRESFGDTRPTREQMAELHQLRQSQREEITALLTDDQIAQLKELHAKRIEDRPERPTVDERVAKLSEALGLSDAQARLLTAAFVEMAQTIKTDDGTRPDKETVRAARAKLRTKIEAILTAEQLEKYKEIMQNRTRKGDRGGRHGDRGGA